MDACQQTALWLAAAGRETPMPVHLQDHLATCASCQSCQARYAKAVTLYAQATDGPGAPMPELATVLPRTHRGRRWGTAFMAAAAAAALVAAALHYLYWPGEPLPKSSTETTITSQRPPEPTVLPHGETLLSTQEIVTDSGETLLSDPAIATVRIAPKSRIRLDTWSTGDTRLRLHAGALEANVHPRAPGQIFEIRTEYATIRVVGTRFVVTHLPGIETVVAGIEGQVSVRTAAGRDAGLVGSGQTLRIPAPGANANPAAADAVKEARPGPEPVTMPRTSQPRASHRPNPPRVDGSRQSRSTQTTPATETAARAEEVLVRARELLAQGHDAEATRMLTSALTDGGSLRPRLLAMLGDAHRLASRFTEARAAYEQALAEGGAQLPEGVFVDLAVMLQAVPEHPEGAERAWRRYLEAHPRGLYAPRALAELASIAEQADRQEESLEWRRRLVVEAPGSNEAMPAFVRVGRAYLDRGALEAAEAWFLQAASDTRPEWAEAALVGLIRVRLAQGRPADVRSLAIEYADRFPSGTRRTEVDRLIAAIGKQPPP